MRVEKPREIAARVLGRHAETGQWLDELLTAECDRARLSPADRGLAYELVLGSVRQQALLDWILARRTDGREQPPRLLLLLRLGLYQMFILDRIPDHAAVNETVELAKQTGFASSAGFVNAVLRGCLRDRELIEREIEELRQSRIDIAYSHPLWLCQRWEKRYGADTLKNLVEWNNRPPPLYGRVNSLKTTPAALQERLTAEGVDWAAMRHDWIPEGEMFEIRKHPPLSSLASFREGLFYIQDPSTLLSVQQMGAVPGETILDLCAAPGGKTTALAQRMQNSGRIVAFDPDPRRRQMIRENCERLGVTMVRIPEGRRGQPGELFDRILIDAPCSNTGVMRRRVELRWRMQEDEIQRLRAIQLELLRESADRLKPGGTLVYSTCSLEPEENGDLVSEFLSTRPTFEKIFERQLTPMADQVDGAYVATLKKAGP